MSSMADLPSLATGYGTGPQSRGSRQAVLVLLALNRRRAGLSAADLQSETRLPRQEVDLAVECLSKRDVITPIGRGRAAYWVLADRSHFDLITEAECARLCAHYIQSQHAASQHRPQA